jgi:uncharacterized SAM-binding protein YcdF (DUF218 family)
MAIRQWDVHSTRGGLDVQWLSVPTSMLFLVRLLVDVRQSSFQPLNLHRVVFASFVPFLLLMYLLHRASSCV